MLGTRKKINNQVIIYQGSTECRLFCCHLQVGKFIQLVATFIGGFVIAFIKGWLLTLVMLSSIPPIVIAGGIMSVVVARMASRGQEAYAKASIVVEQTIGSIRTVGYKCAPRHVLHFL